jgi:AmmeMemoRadiSam system protein A
MNTQLTTEEQKTLLQLARQALEGGVRGDAPAPIRYSELSPALHENGACFVTLTQHGQLRGCIGTLEAHQPLAQDVQEHAIAAALNDYRFPPVTPDELDQIEIEVSRLTDPQPLHYIDSEDLLEKLQPGIDGVTLRDSFGRRATFLPQVWRQLPDKVEFLSHLCHKMGASSDAWRTQRLTVHTYQVEEFHE